MTYKVAIPVYLGSEIVDNLMASMDINWSHIILIDNSPTSYCKKFEGKGAMIYYYPENIGIGRGWNIGLKAGADWTFILSKAMVFPGGFSEFLFQFDPTNEYCYFTDQGWHLAGISRKTVELIGLFDSNFYPGYYEDADYYRRMCLAGIEHGAPHVVPGITSSVGTSIGAGANIHFQPLHDYFVEKWNGGPGDDQKDMYKLPFKDKPLTYFPERSVKELQNKYGYK